MGKIIKVRCNGPQRHENEIDLDIVLRRATVLRGAPAKGDPAIPNRWLRRCSVCTYNVIVTRQVIEENL
jgi:hypothetical protein